jgi:hypothetical protein
MVERTHGQLKAALRAQFAGSRWPEHLPWVLLGLRTAPKEDSGVSAAELVYGAALALSAKFLSTAEPLAAEFLKKLQQVEMPATRPLSYAEAAAKGGIVAGQQRLPAAWWHVAAPVTAVREPIKVLERTDKCFRLAVGSREETVSIDCLKLHLEVGPFTAALPVTCGHPRPPLL